MGERDTEQTIRLTVDDGTAIAGVVLAFRKDGELHELTELEPPVEATLRKC